MLVVIGVKTTEIINKSILCDMNLPPSTTPEVPPEAVKRQGISCFRRYESLKLSICVCNKYLIAILFLGRYVVYGDI